MLDELVNGRRVEDLCALHVLVRICADVDDELEGRRAAGQLIRRVRVQLVERVGRCLDRAVPPHRLLLLANDVHKHFVLAELCGEGERGATEIGCGLDEVLRGQLAILFVGVCGLELDAVLLGVRVDQVLEESLVGLGLGNLKARDVDTRLFFCKKNNKNIRC